MYIPKWMLVVVLILGLLWVGGLILDYLLGNKRGW